MEEIEKESVLRLNNYLPVFVAAAAGISIYSIYRGKGKNGTINASTVTTRWLEEIVKSAGVLSKENSILAATPKLLTGGCHFHVTRFSLQLSFPEKSIGSSIVLKTLTWEKSFGEKAMLAIKKGLRFSDREAMYLNSYEIESRFYKYLGSSISGLHLPKVYFNIEDSFNNQFCMVMEDISELEDGQPNGFAEKEATFTLNQLAKFHASHWGVPNIPKGTKFWNIGGYWTGTKTEADKSQFGTAWEKMVHQFSTELEMNEELKELGPKLYDRLVSLNDRFEAIPRKTLVHGDFKISNLFVDYRKEENRKVYAIDWQWFGMGPAALDVSYYLATSLHPDLLSSREQLMKSYYDALLSFGVKDYSWEEFDKHFKLCWLDFFVYTVVAKWSRMNPEEVETYQRGRKDGLHLRSFAHMKMILRASNQFFNQLEI